MMPGIALYDCAARIRRLWIGYRCEVFRDGRRVFAGRYWTHKAALAAATYWSAVAAFQDRRGVQLPLVDAEGVPVLEGVR